MKTIQLSGSKYGDRSVIVDDADYEFLAQYKWHYHNGYVIRNINVAGKSKKVWLHRLVMMANDSDFQVDHINGDRLDCRKANLRFADTLQNGANRRIGKNNTSGYKGVHYLKKIDKWSARIGTTNKRIYLGVYATPQEAAKAYNEAAKEYYGEFAWLNKV